MYDDPFHIARNEANLSIGLTCIMYLSAVYFPRVAHPISFDISSSVTRYLLHVLRVEFVEVSLFAYSMFFVDYQIESRKSLFSIPFVLLL